MTRQSTAATGTYNFSGKPHLSECKLIALATAESGVER
jgi:hypothetical protein